MHELLISLSIENILTKGTQYDKDSAKMVASLEESKQSSDTAFLLQDNPMGFLVYLY